MKRNPSNDALRTTYKQLVCEYRTAVSDFQCKGESELINSRNVVAQLPALRCAGDIRRYVALHSASTRCAELAQRCIARRGAGAALHIDSDVTMNRHPFAGEAEP